MHIPVLPCPLQRHRQNGKKLKLWAWFSGNRQNYGDAAEKNNTGINVAPNALYVTKVIHFKDKKQRLPCELIKYFSILQKRATMSKQEWELMNLRYNLIVIFHISQGTVWLHCVISQLNEATALIIHCPFSTANVLIGVRDLPIAESSWMCDMYSSSPLQWSRSAWDYWPDRNLVTGCYMADNAETQR